MFDYAIDWEKTIFWIVVPVLVAGVVVVVKYVLPKLNKARKVE
jgi:hypothetical protein